MASERSRKRPGTPVRLKSLAEVQRELARVYEKALNGSISPQQARAACAALRPLLTMIKAEERKRSRSA